MVNNPKDIQKTLKEMKGIKKEELDQALKEVDRAFEELRIEELKTKEKIIERRDYRMKLKMVLVMLITLVSVFAAIFVSTIYTGFVAPYLIGIFTPIILSVIYNFEPKNKTGKK